MLIPGRLDAYAEAVQFSFFVVATRGNSDGFSTGVLQFAPPKIGLPHAIAVILYLAVRGESSRI
jgi:hypothetical protein